MKASWVAKVRCPGREVFWAMGFESLAIHQTKPLRGNPGGFSFAPL